MSTTAHIGVIGAAGYTGGEALRILLNHPHVGQLTAVSQSHAGHPLHEAHADLYGTTSLHFTADVPLDADALLLCVGHGEARKWLEGPLAGYKGRIVDLSQDFRVANTFGSEQFVYGLPERNREATCTTRLVANPGCFATALQLALLPLAQHHLLPEAVFASGVTGATGAGHKPTETNHFNWRSNNLSVYKPLAHQHLHEIRHTLKALQTHWSGNLSFIPYRGPFTRGILATVHAEVALPEAQLRSLYEEYYAPHPFTQVLPAGQESHLKRVVGSNQCTLQLEYVDGTLVVVSAIDNLLKGASGQAVQNLNLLMDWPETAGLTLKSIAF